MLPQLYRDLFPPSPWQRGQNNLAHPGKGGWIARCLQAVPGPFTAGGARGTWGQRKPSSPTRLGAAWSGLGVLPWARIIESRDTDHSRFQALSPGSHIHQHLSCLEKAHKAVIWSTCVYTVTTLLIFYLLLPVRDLCSRASLCHGLLQHGNFCNYY